MQGYYDADDCRIDEFEALISQQLDPAALAFADRVEKNIPIYDVPRLSPVLTDPGQRRALMAEWGGILGEGAGVLVLKAAVGDLAALDAATAIYLEIIEEERANSSGGDHFAAAGANDRVWNSAQKLCLRDPQVFARVFANPAVDAVSEAWLGPGYQMTAQVNLVRPGGQAQVAHRDYHLGFMTVEQAAAFPARAHLLSAALTLQGALAHGDMPLESGPTKLLPFSQAYGPGYLAYHLPAFRDLFEARHVQLPLNKGDALFFNPALFHAAGENRTPDHLRFANLLQVSSPMGRALEALDRLSMARALYRILPGLGLAAGARAAAIAATAEGYPFPTNLDTDPPIGGLAPESPAALMTRMLDEGASPDAFDAELARRDARRRP